MIHNGKFITIKDINQDLHDWQITMVYDPYTFEPKYTVHHSHLGKVYETTIDDDAILFVIHRHWFLKALESNFDTLEKTIRLEIKYNGHKRAMNAIHTFDTLGILPYYTN